MLQLLYNAFLWNTYYLFLCIYTYVDTDMDTDVDVDRCMYMFQTENRLGSEFHKAQYLIIKYLHL